MGRGTEARQLEKLCTVRMTETLHAAVSAAAHGDGLSLPAWFRKLATETLRQVPPAHRPAEIRKSEPRRRKPVPPPDLVEVSRLVGIVGKQTGATKLLADGLARRGERGVMEQVDQLVHNLQRTQRELIDVVERLR